MNYIKDIASQEGKAVLFKGWAANKRSGKGLHFILLRDGTGFIQCVVNQEDVDEQSFSDADDVNLECSLEVEGDVKKDDKQLGGYELQVTNLKLIEKAAEYPIAKKEHGVDFLMDHRHLWLRSRRQWAIMTIRNQIIFAINNFFQDRGFVQMDAPIFTGNVCEGTSTLFETDFYGEPAYLSQSGQLYGEAMAMAMGKIYTFGPTFRAEKSKTRRHLSEFWMIEPEMAFYDLKMDMDLIEEFIRYVVKVVLEKCKPELEIIERDLTTLENIDQAMPRMTYDQAVSIIRGEKEVDGKNSLATLEKDLVAINQQISELSQDVMEREDKIKKGGMKKGEVNFNQHKIDVTKVTISNLKTEAENIPKWIASAKDFQYGSDFGGSDETVLTRLFATPVMVYNWPTAIKAFYMKEDEQDGNFVKGVDVLAPEGFGEIVGGGERETDIEKLKTKIKEHNLPQKEFEWYLDLRRYGSVPHSGFGLGLERFVSWICGLHHIRETIAFPRMYGRLFP